MNNVNKPFNPALKEFDLIYKYFHKPAEVQRIKSQGKNLVDQKILGIGDDCALLKIPTTDFLAISTDTLVEGRHFFEGTDPADVAYKAFMISISDLAAMGATPKWVSLALTLPKLDEQWLARFSAQFFLLTEAFGVTLIGGDTTKGPLTISLVVKGIVNEKYPLKRSGAKAGDDIYVTGELGNSALGLEILKSNPHIPVQIATSKTELFSAIRPILHIDYPSAYKIYQQSETQKFTSCSESLFGLCQMKNIGINTKTDEIDTHCAIQSLKQPLRQPLSDMGYVGAYYFPEARIKLAQDLIYLANSAMDISDGLASDLSHLCHSSQLTAKVELEKLPLNTSFQTTLSKMRKELTYHEAHLLALCGGDDYELVFTCCPNRRNEIAQLAVKHDLPITRIGKMQISKSEPSVEYYYKNSPISLNSVGFDHFASE